MDHPADIEIEASSIGIKTACVKEDDRTLLNVSEVKILFRIIKMTGNEQILFLIICSDKESKKLEDLMESSGDFDTLRSIFEIIKANRGLEYLNMELSENVNTLMNIGEIIGNTKDLKFNRTGQTFSQFELDTALVSSCRRGYKFLVIKLIHLGADKETRDRNGNTPLLICVENGFTSTVKLLIRQEVNINSANDFGDTALILAVRSTRLVKMAIYLLAQSRINVNHQNREGNTALMTAIEAKNFTVMKLILDSKETTKDVLEGMKNCRSETAQDIADKMGIGSTVKLLIKQSTEMCNPILAAVLMCDMDSFDILMDCQFFRPSNKDKCIRESFRRIFMKHKKSGEKFNENEEKIIQRLIRYRVAASCFYTANPFMVATQVGSCTVLKMLLNDKESLKMLCNLRLKNLLGVSAEHGYSDIIELLLKYNHKKSTKSFTMPALISAMKNGHLSCVELLKQHGASLDTEFAFASFVKDNDAVRLKYLVENFKAAIRCAVSAEVMDNYLVAAACSGHIDIIGLLIDAGANVNCAKQMSVMEAINAKNIDFLLQRGAAVNNSSTEHDQVYTPLTYVLSKDYYQCMTMRKVKIVEALLKNGASVNEGCGGNSPLMIGIINKADKNIVQLLLDYGADVTVRDGEGNTVLLNAAKNSSKEIIRCLLQQHTVSNIINVQNHNGLTALMVSVINFDHSVIKALINLGADVNMKDEDGNTSLMIALSMYIRKPEVVTILIQAGSDLNSQNNIGRSPLMLAANASWEDALVMLVNSGADVNAVGRNNVTALSLAVNSMSFHPSCVLSCIEYLLDHGARASYLKPDFLLKLIQKKRFELIPKLIQCGLGPVEDCSSYIGPASITPVSPLCLALMTGNVKLASYFVENLFVTQSDMFTLIHHKDVRNHLHKHKLHECLGFLDKQAAQPLSLFSLAFIAVQSAVGSAPGREERVSTLPLPGKFKDRLMFKTEIQPLDLWATFGEGVVHFSIIVKRILSPIVVKNVYLNAVHNESSSEESSNESSSEESSNKSSSEESSNESSSEEFSNESSSEESSNESSSEESSNEASSDVSFYCD